MQIQTSTIPANKRSVHARNKPHSKRYKRRSNNPSLKRPGSRLRRSKNPAADSLLPSIRQRAGDEERGSLFEGAACSSD
jgi:hypothetical protein